MNSKLETNKSKYSVQGLGLLVSIDSVDEIQVGLTVVGNNRFGSRLVEQAVEQEFKSMK